MQWCTTELVDVFMCSILVLAFDFLGHVLLEEENYKTRQVINYTSVYNSLFT